MRELQNAACAEPRYGAETVFCADRTGLLLWIALYGVVSLLIDRATIA